jgi:hypothetical protein
VSAENKSLVAVYTPWTLDDDAVLVMIDFGAREAWHTGEYSKGKAKGLEMFQHLKQANPEINNQHSEIPLTQIYTRGDSR